MHTEPHRSSKLDPSTAFDVLAEDERRRILATLTDQTDPVSERALAAAVTTDRSAPDAGVESEFRVTLRHTHLPRLDEADLVEWDREAGTVAPTARLRGAGLVRQVVETATEDWDDALECLAEDRRRTALAVLADADGPMTRSHLASEVAARRPDLDQSHAAIRDVEASLHHRHLPQLSSADLVDYAADEGTVEYRRAPAVEDLLATVADGTR